LLLERLLRLLPNDAPLKIVVDDTLAPKKGPHVFGLGTHLDPVRSSRSYRVFVFGHCWVVLAVLMRLPFTRRAWALPILLRLYRTEKECRAKAVPHRKKTELAREMLELLASRVRSRRIEVAADEMYCNSTVLLRLPPSVIMFGSMRTDAVLTAPLPPVRGRRPRGRPRVRGQVLPKPSTLACDSNSPWKMTRAELYGRQRRVPYKTMLAQWYRSTRASLLRVVVVRVDTGDRALRAFFSTDPSVSVSYLLEAYAGRWNIEVCFRELKQLLGFADSSARKRKAVERMAPFVALIYSTLVLWFAQGIFRSLLAAPPLRPWYRHKCTFSFADVLTAARRALAHLDVLDPRRRFKNLRNPRLATPFRRHA
jgi:hypothetical protein